MSNKNTALPYAEALFSLSQKGGEKGTELIDSFVSQMAELSKSKELQSLISNDDIQSTEVVDFILMLVKVLKNDNVRNFIRALPEISEEYYKLKSSTKSAAHAQIMSAYPIPEEQLKAIIPALEKRFNRPLTASVTIDESLIGGYKVVVEDEVLDLTVSSKLQKMQEAIAS